MLWSVLGAVLGAGLAVAGARLALEGRSVLKHRPEGGDGGADRLGSVLGVSASSRVAIGLMLVIAGYHAAAWSLPSRWFPLQVPLDRWWVLAGALAVGLSLTLLADRIERDGDGGG